LSYGRMSRGRQHGRPQDWTRIAEPGEVLRIAAGSPPDHSWGRFEPPVPSPVGGSV